MDFPHIRNGMDYDDDDDAAADGICQCTQLSSDANYIYYIYLYFRRYIKIFVQGSCKPLGWKIPHYVVICDTVGILLAIKCLQIPTYSKVGNLTEKFLRQQRARSSRGGGVIGRMGMGCGCGRERGRGINKNDEMPKSQNFRQSQNKDQKKNKIKFRGKDIGGRASIYRINK